MTPSTPTSPFELEVHDALHADPDRARDVRELLATIAEEDSVEAFNEPFTRAVSDDAGHRHILAVATDPQSAPAPVLGVIAVDDTNVVELAVHPEARHQGIAHTLLSRLVPDLGIDPVVDVWAHGDGAAAQAFVSSIGARRQRELYKMSIRTRPGSPTTDRFRADADSARTFFADAGIVILNAAESAERFGAELVDAEWVRVNNEAFAWHPEQGGWSTDRLDRARRPEWFRPEGVVMLWDLDDAPTLLGFHWTKVPTAERELEAGERSGEVYVVCLANDARGRGFGGPLTVLGIELLLDAGVGTVELYVEGDNAPAVSTYRSLGFDVVHTDVMYRGDLSELFA